jgi:hypothetical protein
MQPFGLPVRIEQEVDMTPDLGDSRMPHFDFFFEESATGPEKIGIHGLRSVTTRKTKERLNLMTGRVLFAECRFTRAAGNIGSSDISRSVT